MANFDSVELVNEIEENDKEIAKKLVSLRVRACISVEDFAEALGVEVAELTSYENGSESVPASVIALVCALSGVPLEHFFGNDSAYDASINYTTSAQAQPALMS